MRDLLVLEQFSERKRDKLFDVYWQCGLTHRSIRLILLVFAPTIHAAAEPNHVGRHDPIREQKSFFAP